jgi:Lrp/AsnC family leucine-responsive transcriptional regulator
MPNDRRTSGIALDEIDRTLLDALALNARTPIAELARRVGLSPQSTADRVRRLEDVGVIAGFTIRLDRLALGLPIGAYIRIRPAMGELRRVAQLVAALPEVVECDRITGDDCFIAKVFVASTEDLERVIDKLLPHAQTNTSIIQSSTVVARQLTRPA